MLYRDSQVIAIRGESGPNRANQNALAPGVDQRRPAWISADQCGSGLTRADYRGSTQKSADQCGSAQGPDEPIAKVPVLARDWDSKACLRNWIPSDHLGHYHTPSEIEIARMPRYQIHLHSLSENQHIPRVFRLRRLILFVLSGLVLSQTSAGLTLRIIWTPSEATQCAERTY